MAGESSRSVYTSNGWEIDLTRRELRSGGVSVPIGSRAFEILEVLVRAGGELVNKHDLMGRVWPGAIVEENTLQFHISAIRKVLGADRGLLKTVSGRGYRLLGAWTLRQTTKPEHPPGISERRPRQPFRSNLPIAGSALIGRSAARQHLLDVFSAYRVVTLTGPGGIGKSVLASDVARSLFSSFRGNSWLVELASLSDPALVPSAVASVVGLSIVGTQISAESVARAIDGENLLLILDNCEHLSEAAATLAETIVRMCPNASILATSRETLRIEGEYVYRVPPLEVPPERREDAAELERYSAVQLFVARLTALDSRFSARSDALPLIGAICRQLDGIPLAIEFAAARAATLGLEQIARRLNDRFRLLTVGRRTALPRHQTLRATLDWSFHLLQGTEQTLLCRLSLFAGGFTLEAAAAVMRDTGATESTVAEGIADLVAKSLVSLDTSVPGRWRLLETIRAYALEKLAEIGEHDHVARLHAAFFRNMLAPATNEPLVPRDALPRYVHEIDNVRAALDWAFSREGADLEIGISLAVAAVPVLLAMSLLLECHRWSKRALLALAGSRLGSAEEMHLEAGIGFSAMFTQGGSDAARAALERSLAIAEKRGDVTYQLWLLGSLCIFHFRNGSFQTSLQYARRNSAAAKIMGDSAAVGLAHFLLGNLLHSVGNLSEARAELEAALQYRQSPQISTVYLGYDHHLLASISLANTLCLQGYPNQAAERARQTIKEAQGIDNPITLSIILRHAVLLFFWISDLKSAEEIIGWYISNAHFHSLGPQVMAGRGLNGILAIHRGDAQRGVEILHDCMRELHTARYALMASEFNISLAEGLAAIGRFTESMKLIDDGLDLVEANGDTIYLPELLRLKAALLLSIPLPRADEAEMNLLHSLELSRQQGARAWELRTATDLAKLMAAQGRYQDARVLLLPVFSGFDDDLETADLKSAKRLLQSLQ